MIAGIATSRLTPKWRNLVALGVLASALYGVSYQQFRHFDPSDPRGADDSASYLRMSHGDYGVNPVRRYRFLVPTMAAALRPAVQGVVRDPGEVDLVCFYAVNFAFSLTAAWFLHQLLLALRFPMASALLGSLMFVSSRITVMATGTPLIDASFLAAVAIVAYLSATNRVLWLSALLPVLMLTKETMVLIACVPLLSPAFRKAGYGLSVAGSLLLAYVVRHRIDELAGAGPGQVATPTFWAIVLAHFSGFGDNLLALFTLKGLHDLQNGYSFFLVIALLGFLLNRRRHALRDQAVLLGLVPVALFLALLSGSLGRMFFMAFPAVIAYAVLFVQEALGLPPGMETAPECGGRTTTAGRYR